MKYVLLFGFVFLFLGCSRGDEQSSQAVSSLVEEVADSDSDQPPSDVAIDDETYGYSLGDVGHVLFQNGTITLFFFSSNELQWFEMDLADLRLNDEGWYEAHIMGKSFLVLKGGNFFRIFNRDLDERPFDFWVGSPRLEGNEYDTMYDFGIQSIHASSVYSEVIGGESVTYSAEGINEFLFRDYLGISRYWNADHLPWVEGEDGPGIGVTLDVTFAEPSDHMLVLNGFVDPLRRHLFRENNRVKRALIRSLDAGTPFSFEYEFTDAVEFSHFQFPQPVSAVQLEILDVYPGDRWDDTAISAIIRNHTWEFNEERLGNLIRSKAPENQYHGPE